MSEKSRLISTKNVDHFFQNIEELFQNVGDFKKNLLRFQMMLESDEFFAPSSENASLFEALLLST